jgi:hypothetical protein
MFSSSIELRDHPAIRWRTTFWYYAALAIQHVTQVPSSRLAGGWTGWKKYAVSGETACPTFNFITVRRK